MPVPTSGCWPGPQVELDGTASFDPDPGDLITHSWALTGLTVTPPIRVTPLSAADQAALNPFWPRASVYPDVLTAARTPLPRFQAPNLIGPHQRAPDLHPLRDRPRGPHRPRRGACHRGGPLLLRGGHRPQFLREPQPGRPGHLPLRHRPRRHRRPLRFALHPPRSRSSPKRPGPVGRPRSPQVRPRGASRLPAGLRRRLRRRPGRP